jgi:hypothetical protein
MRRLLHGFVVLCGFYCLVGLASAHELGRSQFAAPLPLPLLFLGAGGTVALTAGWLGVTDRVTTADARHRVTSLSAGTGTGIRALGRVLFFALFTVAIVHGVLGRQVAAENLATVFVWPLWLKGIGLLAILTIVRDLLGGSGPAITMLGWLSVPFFWGSQVLLIVGGHVVAVVAAHRVAVRRYESLALARRGHLPLVVVMVGYTVLSLWIISRPLVT